MLRQLRLPNSRIASSGLALASRTSVVPCSHHFRNNNLPFCYRQAALLYAQRRFLNLHEYQSKIQLAKHGVRVSRGQMAQTPEEADAKSREMLNGGICFFLVPSLTGMCTGVKKFFVKAQILAGGRGKGTFSNGFQGGVHQAKSQPEVAVIARKMLGNTLITKQTGPAGQTVKKVLIDEGLEFDKSLPEMYLAFVMDRSFGGPVMVGSRYGGVNIEEVAAKDPAAILKEPIDIQVGLSEAQCAKMGKALGFPDAMIPDFAEQTMNLYKMFISNDCTQIEINPLAVANGKVYCADAKLNFDDNSSFRHKDLFLLRDRSMEDPREVAASQYDLNYIGLDGNIACMVNGAGLAMATMDIIHAYGGSPANFLDVGGGASEKQVEEAFRILTADKNVKAILVNIFGGIMKCDVIAQGIINAARNINISVPLIVRLEGTNVSLGNKLLKESGIKLMVADCLDDAAQKAVSEMKKFTGQS
jgi:succinyl-CoA synthetase beta subunit